MENLFLMISAIKEFIRIYKIQTSSLKFQFAKILTIEEITFYRNLRYYKHPNALKNNK